MATTIKLEINRSLINYNFEGYKLSLDKLPLYPLDTDNGLDSVELADDQFSYHHAKLFGVHNLLILDAWNSSIVYYVDQQWNVIRALAHENSFNSAMTMFKIPDAANQQLVPRRCNVVLQFISTDLVVICDGAGQIHIVETGDRNESQDKMWKLLYSKTVPQQKLPCLLVDAMELSNDENHKIECLLVHVTESTPDEKDKYRSQYLTVLEWVTFGSVDRKSWTLERTRQLVSRKPFHVASLGREGGSITIAGEADFVFTKDSEVPVVSDDDKKDETAGDENPNYTWHQTAEDVSVQFTVQEGVTKGDIYMTLSFNYIDFGVKNKEPLLKGSLHGEIDTESSTWTIDGRMVVLYLLKRTEGNWPLVVQGDTRGEMLVDPAEAAVIHERLAHLTSDELNPAPDKANKPYNTQQLEECDMFPDDNSVLVRIDGNTHCVTHKIGLGSHQWLFNIDLGHNSTPAICLRHDVDGLLWKQETSKGEEYKWVHSATFNALGYVQASKEQRKFSSSPSDCSYAVICDVSQHIYIYRQSVSVGTTLCNRKIGQEVNSVAKQQVITLDTADTILGLKAMKDRLFVATQNRLYMIKVGETST